MGIRTDVDINLTAVTHEGKPKHKKWLTAVAADAHIQLFIKILTVNYAQHRQIRHASLKLKLHLGIELLNWLTFQIFLLL